MHARRPNEIQTRSTEAGALSANWTLCTWQRTCSQTSTHTCTIIKRSPSKDNQQQSDRTNANGLSHFHRIRARRGYRTARNVSAIDVYRMNKDRSPLSHVQSHKQSTNRPTVRSGETTRIQSSFVSRRVYTTISSIIRHCSTCANDLKSRPLSNLPYQTVDSFRKAIKTRLHTVSVRAIGATTIWTGERSSQTFGLGDQQCIPPTFWS